jgi:hypothetical protein
VATVGGPAKDPTSPSSMDVSVAIALEEGISLGEEEASEGINAAFPIGAVVTGPPGLA